MNMVRICSTDKGKKQNMNPKRRKENKNKREKELQIEYKVQKLIQSLQKKSLHS